MSPADLKREIFEVLSGFWQIRAAMAYLRTSIAVTVTDATPLQFDNVPQYGLAAGFFGAETLGTSLRNLDTYENGRMVNDIFLALLARLEIFLSDKLASAGLIHTGTLGKLQNNAQAHYGITGIEVDCMDEVRERRNTIIHNHGAITPNYAAAANKVVGVSGGHVVAPGTITKVEATATYLSYAADVLIRYSSKYP